MDTDALRPTPYEIWREIERIPETREVRRQMYLDRMREVGHIIDREEGDESPLFACGFDPRNESADDTFERTMTDIRDAERAADRDTVI